MGENCAGGAPRRDRHACSAVALQSDGLDECVLWNATTRWFPLAGLCVADAVHDPGLPSC